MKAILKFLIGALERMGGRRQMDPILEPEIRNSESARADGRPADCWIGRISGAAVPGAIRGGPDAPLTTTRMETMHEKWNRPEFVRAMVAAAFLTLKEAFGDSGSWSVRRTGSRIYLNKKGSKHPSIRIVPCCAVTGRTAAPLVPPLQSKRCRRAAKEIRRRLLKHDGRAGTMRTFPRLSLDDDPDADRLWVEASPIVESGSGWDVVDHEARLCLDVTDVAGR